MSTFDSINSRDWNLTDFPIFNTCNCSQPILAFFYFCFCIPNATISFQSHQNAQSFFPCSDLFQKAGSGEKRRVKFLNQMSAGIQFGKTCQIPMCLRHDVMQWSNQYLADGLSFTLNVSFFI